ncbi:LytR C-terminal domain-containing protein [Nitrosospira lacus]|nr:tetratricopeptide repeat protein [Nitrosospira lacus]
MFKVKRLVWVMSCVSVMGGCALYQSSDKQALSIKPVMDVKHATGGAEAMYWLGRYYQGKMNYTEAAAAYEKALAADPAHAEAHNGLGVSYSLLGRHELALQHFRKAIELLPMAAHLHNNLGYAHFARGQESEAVAAFEQALRLDPENRQARSNLAAAYEKAELHDEAAMLRMARPEPTAAPDTFSATIPAAPSRLVQVTPNVFELRMTDADSMTALRTGRSTGKTAVSQDAGNLDSKDVRIEVSNGNGMSGMAAQVSGFLQRSGFAKARLTDRPPYQQVQTEIHYRPGNSVLAGQISQMMPKQAPVVESYNLRREVQVRVLLGKDFAREAAYFDNRGKIQVALSAGKAADAEEPRE